MIPLFIEFANELAESLGGKQSCAFARVVLAEVNRFTHIGVGFAPNFAALFDDHCGQFIATRAHSCRGFDEDIGARAVLAVAPGRKRSVCLGDDARGITRS